MKKLLLIFFVLIWLIPVAFGSGIQITSNGISKNTVKKIIGTKTPNSIVLIGDSITALCTPFSTATTLGTGDDNWWAWAQSRLNHKFNVVNYAGVGGETLAQIAERIDTDVIAYAPHYCIVAGGVNSINVVEDVDELIVSWTSIINKLIAANIVPIILPPFLSGNITNPDNIAIWHDANRWLQESADDMNFYYLDQNKYYMDYAAAGPHPLAGTVETDDNVHLNGTGGYLVGKAVAEGMQKIIPYSFTTRITNNADTNILTDNPLMTGTGGITTAGCTGDVATNWKIEVTNGTIVCSKIEREHAGYWQGLNLTASADNGLCFFTNLKTSVEAYVGETVHVEAEILIPDDIDVGDQISDLAGIWMSVSMYNSDYSTTYQVLYVLNHQVSAITGFADGFKPGDTFLMRSPGFVVPEGVVNIKISLKYSAQNGGGGMIYVGSAGVVVEQ